jgi:hypothetical protein
LLPGFWSRRPPLGRKSQAEERRLARRRERHSVARCHAWNAFSRAAHGRAQGRIVAEQHRSHVVVVDPVHPGLRVDLRRVVRREEASLFSWREAMSTKIRNEVSLNANLSGSGSANMPRVTSTRSMSS